MNTDLAETYAEIDGLLASTLEVDDHVDLDQLKTTAEHPPFEPGKLETPTDPVPEPVYPPEPVLQEPPAPTGLSSAFGGKKKHQAALERARAEHAAAVQAWHASNTQTYNDYLAECERREQVEQQRLTKLAAAEAEYAEECRKREAEVEERNAELARLINNLAFDVPEAIEEYVSIVLSNSVYPEAFPVTHEHTFDLTSRELTLTVTVPEPAAIPTIKEFRYV
jgi:restriction system protein